MSSLRISVLSAFLIAAGCAPGEQTDSVPPDPSQTVDELHTTGAGTAADDTNESAASRDADASPDVNAGKQNGDEATASTDVARSPEDVLRLFLLAMLDADRNGLALRSLPHDDLDILLGGDVPPEAMVALKSEVESMPITRLRLGTEITLPGGEPLILNEELVNSQRVQLGTPGNPIPFDVVLIDGQWRVNPAPMIEARLAAKAAMEQNGQTP